MRIQSWSAAILLGLAACAAPRAVRALDLEGALREVAAANPALAARSEMAEAARRRIAPAGAWASPMLELGVVNVPTSGRFDMDMMTMKMIGLEQRVPISGANGLARISATEAWRAERADVDMARYDAFAMAWEAYADAYFAGELSRAAAGHRGVMDQMAASARARYQSGTGRLEDVLRAEAEAARIDADFASYDAEERAARARLDALRGRSPGAAPESLAAPPERLAPDDSPEWQQALAAGHPRLRVADAQAARYDAAARASRRMLWPDLDLKYSYGIRERLVGGIDQDNMFSASVGLMLPLFARGRELSESAEMSAMARASRSDRAAAALDLAQQLASARAEAAAASRGAGLLRDTVLVTQRRALEASWAAYRAGTVDLWRVFESAHALYTEEVELARARQNLAHAHARILSITARGSLVGVSLPESRDARSEP